MRGKNIDDAIDGGRRGIGVQRTKRQMARLGDAESRLDGLEISHLAHQHHVRVFAQCGAQGLTKPFGVGVDLALVDQAVLVGMHELDRVFDGQDVFVAIAVDLVDHGRKRR